MKGYSKVSARILVVEDNEDLAQLLSYILQREGYEVTQLSDGKGVAEYVEDGAPPEAVLLDVMLPYANGFELLEKIRGSASWSRVPVLVLSGKTHEEVIVRALDSGANDYLSKPFQPQELLARLRRLIPQGGR